MRISCSWMCVALQPRHQRENAGGSRFVTAVDTAPFVIGSLTTVADGGRRREDHFGRRQPGRRQFLALPQHPGQRVRVVEGHQRA